MKRWVETAVMSSTLLAPALTWACPACANRDGGGWQTALVIGLMIAAPYTIFSIVLRILRRLEQAENGVPAAGNALLSPAHENSIPGNRPPGKCVAARRPH